MENTSEVDWSGVNLSLVSGRPISFTMDLYEPLYVARPEEQLELYASLRPQVYGQDLATGRRLLSSGSWRSRESRGKSLRLEEPERSERICAIRPGPRKPGCGARLRRCRCGRGGWNRTDGQANLARSVRPAAQAGNVGNLFQYAIATPVILPRQQSAMLPIVNAEVEGQKVSIYNTGVDAKHPLYGLRFTNPTDLYLMQGPITVFDGGVYGGDAKIEDIPPGSERLISYGLDLDTEVACQSKRVSRGAARGAAGRRALMTVTHKFAADASSTRSKTPATGEDGADRVPDRAGLDARQPKEPAEKTRDRYRFAVEAKPGDRPSCT